MRRSAVLLFIMLASVPVRGQDDGDAYRFDLNDGDIKEVSGDAFLLYAPIGDGESIFERAVRYRFGFTRYDRRGYSGLFSEQHLENLDLSSRVSRYPDYDLSSALGRSLLERENNFRGFSRYGEVSAFEATEYYIADPGYARHAFSINYSDRKYKTDFMALGEYKTPGKWYYRVNARGRFGRDAYITGVFTENMLLSGTLGKTFGQGGRLNLFIMVFSTNEGSRSWATKEVFELTGDNYYNPSWGYFNGKVRNSKIYGGRSALVTATYDIPHPEGTKTKYKVSAGYRLGERSRSGLTWYDARNPYPDYYMNLPGYFSDADLAGQVTGIWKSGDSGYIQLNWYDMWETNTYSTGGAVFVADERIEEIHGGQTAFSASTRIDKQSRFDWGARLGTEGRRYYKRVENLLGAEYLLDVDQYLIDNSYYSDKTLNDARNPDRKVRVNEKFGYDYSIVRTFASAYGTIHYSANNLHMSVGGTLTFSSLYRDGHFEKETFPGNESFGKSAKISSAAYDFKASAQYFFTPSHSLGAILSVVEKEQSHEDIFLNPASHNFLADHGNMNISGVEIHYKGVLSPPLLLEISAYFTSTGNQTEIYRYYDDLYADYSSDNLSGYSVMVMSGIAKRFRGLEAGFSVDATPRLRLSLAGAVGDYAYSNNPDVKIFADVNLAERLTEAKSYLKGYVTDVSPQTVLSASLGYNTPSGWRADISWTFADRRYVSLSPVRRTGRIAALASSPETAAEFKYQERLPAAAVIDLYVAKNFHLAGRFVYISLSVNNLLDKTIIYGGYEQARIRRSGSGVNVAYTPFPSKYAYAYPRTFRITAYINI